MEDLTAEQRGSLTMFQEVTANARDEPISVQLLKSCNWSVDQALQLHWATDTMDMAPAPSASAPSRPSQGPSGGPGGLGEPLLMPQGGGGGQAVQATAEAVPSLFGWITQRVKSIGASVFGLLFNFIFGTGSTFGSGLTSGAAFSHSLTSSYGATLQLPNFFEGSFSQALAAARRDVKLLVVYLHSEHARYTQPFCTDVLSNEFVRTVLNESFVLWGGDVARMEAHQVAQLIHARQFPCFCVLLPASVDEIRVIGQQHGQIQADAVTALLAACMDEMDNHRSEIVARQVQHVEDRDLRQDQDREYQQALEVDKKRSEEKRQQEQEQREAQLLVDQQLRADKELIAKQEAEQQARVDRRRMAAAALPAEDGIEARGISLRLPTGQRVERKFLQTATLAEVYAWADCVAYLPENEGKGFEIPQRFNLKTSFPTAELTDMAKTVEELKLAGSSILLAEIEDED